MSTNWGSFYQRLGIGPEGRDPGYSPPSEGLKKRTVQTVPIDAMTGLPLAQTQTASNPRDGMEEGGFYEVAPDGSLYLNRPAAPAQTALPTIDATDPIDMFEQFGIMPSAPKNPAVGAIETAVRAPQPQVQRGMFGRGLMAWDPAVSVGPAPAGDPWGTSDGRDLRTGPSEARPGMATGVPRARDRSDTPLETPQPRKGSQADMEVLAQKYKKNLLGEGAGPAILRGRGGYVSSGSNGGLGPGALMPTRTVSGGIRNSYGD